jgi:hypothetical protein
VNAPAKSIFQRRKSSHAHAVSAKKVKIRRAWSPIVGSFIVPHMASEVSFTKGELRGVLPGPAKLQFVIAHPFRFPAAVAQPAVLMAASRTCWRTNRGAEGR